MEKKKHPSFYILWVFIFVLISYTLFTFLYLKVAGVYGVAVIKEGVPTTEGIDFKYEFMYKGSIYTGVFTDLAAIKVGEKYYVLFLKSNPDRSLLQYDSPVPNCFKDSTNSYWSYLPACSIDSTLTHEKDKQR